MVDITSDLLVFVWYSQAAMRSSPVSRACVQYGRRTLISGNEGGISTIGLCCGKPGKGTEQENLELHVE